MKDLEQKIKHHYVWGHYLKEWTNDGKNIHYITKRGNLACDSIKGLGAQKDFYKMGELKEQDKEIINIIIKNCNPTLKSLHLNFIDIIFKAQKAFAYYTPMFTKKTGINLNDLMASNLFENYLSQQESRAVFYLKKLKGGDISFFSVKETDYEFCYFLAYQQFRTIKMKRLLTSTLGYNNGHQKLIGRLQDFYHKHWWFMCSFFATNISYDMSMNKDRRVFILENETNIEFITSDQPVINLNPEGHNGKHVDYYYPLSPRKALLIQTSENIYFDYLNLRTQDVRQLNAKIADESCETIFGNSKEIISENKMFFSSRFYLNFI